jgi:hypothetical protein
MSWMLREAGARYANIARGAGLSQSRVQQVCQSCDASTAVYDRWFSQKHGKLHSQNAWGKLHVMVGTITHGLCTILVSGARCPPNFRAEPPQSFKDAAF